MAASSATMPATDTSVSPEQVQNSKLHGPRAGQKPPLTLPPDLVAATFHSPATSTSNSSGSSPSVSQPSSPSQGHGPVVPAYPYNTSLLPFLSPANGNTPDDSEVTTRIPSVQVDYLSHEWQEEDVWASWRATTKHKASMANGVRLENASWRTWNKQRNNLKTISPETLNWLKDSDVTWLYGPLHTGGVDIMPKPNEPAKAEDRLGLDFHTSSRNSRPIIPERSGSNSSTVSTPGYTSRSASPRSQAVPKKPILKYRSLTDILTVPSFGRRARFDSEDMSSDGGADSADERILSPTSSQPSSSLRNPIRPDDLPQPKSAPSEALPPSPNVSAPLINSDAQGRTSPSADGSSDTGTDTTSTSDTGGGRKKRRHIAFSHRVEQCIAVDSEEDRERYNNSSNQDFNQLRRQKGSGSYFQRHPASHPDFSDGTSDDDEEVLTFRPKRNSSHSNLTHHQAPLSPPEHYTIAKLAPTFLKNSESLPSPSPAIVYSPQKASQQQDDNNDSTDDSYTPTATSPVVNTSALPPRNYMIVQQQSGGRRATVTAPVPPAAQTFYSKSPTTEQPISQWDGDEEEFASIGLDYYGTGDPSGGDLDFNDFGQEGGGGSGMYASHDPIPRGYYAQQVARSPKGTTFELDDDKSSSSADMGTPTTKTIGLAGSDAMSPNRSAEVGKSILKTRKPLSAESSSDSLHSNSDGSAASSPGLIPPSNGLQIVADDEGLARGRSLSRGSSSSSLDGRSVSRTASSGGSPADYVGGIALRGPDVPRRVKERRSTDNLLYGSSPSEDSMPSGPHETGMKRRVSISEEEPEIIPEEQSEQEESVKDEGERYSSRDARPTSSDKAETAKSPIPDESKKSPSSTFISPDLALGLNYQDHTYVSSAYEAAGVAKDLPA